jgi:hypothetical protein
VQLHQLGSKSREPLGLPLGIAEFNGDVLSLTITELAQPLPEGLNQRRASDLREVPDPLHWLLRRGGGWRGEDDEGKRDESSNGAQPHGRLLKSAFCRPSSFYNEAYLLNMWDISA